MADRYSRDGRRRVEPPCEFGHRLQAMECPSCAEQLTGNRSSPEWWVWYRHRAGKRTRDTKGEPDA